MHNSLRYTDIHPTTPPPAFVDAFADVVARSAGQVCAVCALQRMGHGPESSWLGYAPHEWRGVDTDAAGIARARELTVTAYRIRDAREDRDTVTTLERALAADILDRTE